MTLPHVDCAVVGGPRDGDRIHLPAHALALQHCYLSGATAPGVYWRAAGLGPLVLTFLPAPGGQFLGPPEVVEPVSPRGLALCH
jgi:hypothetical protein